MSPAGAGGEHGVRPPLPAPRSATGDGAAPAWPAADYVRLPPRRRYVWVPVSDRRAALGGLALYQASRPLAQAVRALAVAAVWLTGPRALRLARSRWSPPVPADHWHQLRAQWQAVAPGFDAVAVRERPQTSREGFGLLLLCRGAAAGFLKVRPGRSSLQVERRVLEALAGGTGALRTPRVLASGSTGAWSWLALDPLPAERLTGRTASADEVRAALALARPALLTALPRPAGTPQGWEPCHGDLVPWNLRRDALGQLWVFDWEDAGWGPPDADDVYYRAWRAVLQGTSPGDAEPGTAEFWLTRVRERSPADEDAARAVRLVAVLEQMRARAPA